MKALHLIPSLGPGGAERQLAIIAPALAEAGLEVHVAYCTGGPNLARLEDSDVHLHPLSARGNHDPLLAWKVARLVWQLQPDVVQTWMLQMDILGGAAALLNRVPVVISERSSRENYETNWKSRLRLLLGQRAAAVLANSRGGLAYWQGHIRPNRLHLIRNCVEVPVAAPTFQAPAATLYPQLQDRQIVMFAGRFSFEKNIPVLLDALILVAYHRPEVAIMMFGEGPERDAAIRKVEQAGLARQFLFPGYCSELVPWMKRATLCVSASHFEGHPNVVMEAAVAGCPLVLSDIAAHREIFNNDAATLVAAITPESFAAAVMDTLQDPLQAQVKAARAHQIVLQWSLPATLRAYKSLYQQLAPAKFAHLTKP